MRKRTLILTGTVLLLTLVLAIPASASKSWKIKGEVIAADLLPPIPPLEVQRGNTCHVTANVRDTWAGDMVGVSMKEERIMAKGPCMGGPYWEEVNRIEHYFTGTILGSQVGTIRISCSAKTNVAPYLDPNAVWETFCVLHSGTGGLANVHGHFREVYPASWVSPDPSNRPTYEGEVHFDPK